MRIWSVPARLAAFGNGPMREVAIADLRAALECLLKWYGQEMN
jgi:hypothetical protein